jgi:hypothetical protein
VFTFLLYLISDVCSVFEQACEHLYIHIM